MFFVDYSLPFNTIIPSQLINKLYALGLNLSTCKWLLDILTNGPYSFSFTSYTLTLSTVVPQGCVLSPFLYALFTHLLLHLWMIRLPLGSDEATYKVLTITEDLSWAF